jgi:hypothetical protein
LLSKIEQSKSQGADHEQQRLKDLMERMSMEPSGSPVSAGGGRKKSIPAPLSTSNQQPGGYPSSSQPLYNPAASPPVTPRYPMTTGTPAQQQYYNQSSNGYQQPRRESYQNPPNSQPQPQTQYAQTPSSYNPTQYGPVSPPAHQQYFSPPPNQHQQHQPWGQPPSAHPGSAYPSSSTPQPGGFPQMPQGYVPPPPPPGPPPNQIGDYSQYGSAYPAGPGGYAQHPQHGQRGSQGQAGQGQGQAQGQDPWAGLSGWR